MLRSFAPRNHLWVVAVAVAQNVIRLRRQGLLCRATLRVLHIGRTDALHSACKVSHLNSNAHGRARESLRQCLQWVTEQGPTVDAGQLAQLLKGQIEIHSAGSMRAEPCSGSCEEASGRLVESETGVPEGVGDDCLNGLLSPEKSTVAGGTAMEDTPDAGARKRRAGEDAFMLEDERLLQALPAVWPGRKMARRSMSIEPKLPLIHPD